MLYENNGNNQIDDLDKLKSKKQQEKSENIGRHGHLY